MAGISVQSKTSSSVTLYVSGLDTSWSNGPRTANWYLTKSGLKPTESAYDYKTSATIANGVSSGGYVTFTGLESNHTYGILCSIYYGSTFLKDFTGEVKTDYAGSGGDDSGGSTVMRKWDWNDSPGSCNEQGYAAARASETRDAYDAVVNKTATTNFSRYVWYDLVDIVFELKKNTTTGWDEDYANIGNTKSLNADRELTAVAFNSLRNNLELAGLHVGLAKIPDGTGAVAGTIPHPVKTGDKVYGHYFITLTDYINACIDNL